PRSTSASTIVPVVVVPIFCVLVVAAIYLFLRRKNQKLEKEGDPTSGLGITDTYEIHYEDIQAMKPKKQNIWTIDAVLGGQ
ncbi:hypothetical protein MMC19_004541, partial [Ptychographa xylographoides]|nr:hypothetical protein [Ptychographa xylographoides]